METMSKIEIGQGKTCLEGHVLDKMMKSLFV